MNEIMLFKSIVFPFFASFFPCFLFFSLCFFLYHFFKIPINFLPIEKMTDKKDKSVVLLKSIIEVFFFFSFFLPLYEHDLMVNLNFLPPFPLSSFANLIGIENRSRDLATFSSVCREISRNYEGFKLFFFFFLKKAVLYFL